MAGTIIAALSPITSAAAPVITGTMAPPTMATHSTPEPSAVRGPRPSEANAKMVGNMIELNRPMASNDQPDTAPTVLADTSSNTTTMVALKASTLPGETYFSTKAPMKRPTNAPPQ